MASNHSKDGPLLEGLLLPGFDALPRSVRPVVEAQMPDRLDPKRQETEGDDDLYRPLRRVEDGREALNMRGYDPRRYLKQDL